MVSIWAFYHLWTSEMALVCELLLFNRSVVSNSLWLYGLQHARLPCCSSSPGACSNPCPLSQWCHPTMSSSVAPFSSCLQSFPASGSNHPICSILLWKLKQTEIYIHMHIQLEEDMAPHSSVLAWRIPWTEEPGGLQSMGSQRVRHNWSDIACTSIYNASDNGRHLFSASQVLF